MHLLPPKKRTNAPPRPRILVKVFPGQFDALELAKNGDASELLITSAEPGVPAGASFLLRQLAIRACAGAVKKKSGHPVHALLIQRHEAELHRSHVAGETGLLALLRDMQAAGFATLGQDEVRFDNGSVLRWAACGSEAEIGRVLDRRVDLLLIDQAEEVTEGLFSRLREVALASPAPGLKVIAAAHSAAEAGWIGRHWSVNGSSGRKWIALDPAELDPEMVKRPAFPTYRGWLEQTFPDEFVWAPHTPSIVAAIDRWIDGEFDHLAVFMPSQHGKTEAGPRHAVPYILKRFPGDWCAVVSYNSEIANARSADARDLFLRAGGELMAARKKVRQWLTQGNGGCWSSGMGAGQTGHSSSWGFLDDPDADWEDATNRAKQAKKQRRYTSVFRARESMFAGGMRRQKLCATVTRWDPDDLIGFAMKSSHAALEANPEAHERWGILALPALSDPGVQDGYRKLYPRFAVLPDFRQGKDVPLWPERRSVSDWRTVFALRGPIIAACECQQSPLGVESGGQFEKEWFVRLERDPAFAGERPNEAVYAASTRAWDFAWTEGAGDYTVGAKLGRTVDGGEILVRHVVRAQLGPRGVNQLIAAAMILDGPTVKIRLPLDPAAGRAAADEITRYLRQVASWIGMPMPEIVCKVPRRAATAHESAKSARARPFRSRAQPPGEGIPGGIAYVATPWEPSLANRVEEWQERVAAHPELREIAEKARLFAGDWWTFWLQIFQSFTGDEGRVDDDVDATVDSYDEVHQEPVEIIAGAMFRPPGW